MKATKELGVKLPIHHLQVLLPPPLTEAVYFSQRKLLAKLAFTQGKLCQRQLEMTARS